MRNIERVKLARSKGVNSQKTVFDEILDSKLPPYEKRPGRLQEEAQNISIAGTETTSWTLSVLFFYLLTTPHVLTKLREELMTNFPEKSTMPSLTEVEQLPYLSAVISEGLRVGMGTSNRQTRACPDEVLVFDDGKKVWEIPKGVSLISHGVQDTDNRTDSCRHGHSSCAFQSSSVLQPLDLFARALD